jgi:lipopolysaccharide transport system permease protein
MSGLVAFGIQFALLLCVSIGFVLAGTGVSLQWTALPVVPLLVLYVAALGMGVGLIVSALTVRFRDLAYAVGFMTQLWMYASPVVYPYSQIPEKYRWFFHFNPMTTPVESLRSAMFGTDGISASILAANLAVTALLLVAGLILFSRAESNAMDTV